MSQLKDQIIAIDGPAGSGKSSITKAIADKFNLNHIDTGALFRVIALLLDKDDIELDSIQSYLKNLNISYDNSQHTLKLEVNHIDYAQEIRKHHISELASKYSKLKDVRSKVEELEREIVKSSKKMSILEGRDIGSFVFPNALLKVYLTASSKVRAQRRLDELKNKNPSEEITLEQMIADVEKRDFNDINREHAPLVKADDAIEIDTTSLGFDEVLGKISDLIEEKGIL